MLELYKRLDVSLADLFAGEIVETKSLTGQYENNLLEMTRQKELDDKRLLRMEMVEIGLGFVFLTVLILLACLLGMELWLRIFLFALGFFVFLIAVSVGVRIEQVTGYYECGHCHYRYTPSFHRVLFSAYNGKARYLKCPRCKRRSWSKKVIKEK